MNINMNKLHNCKNPYQGAQKRVLTVCSAGLLRSPTAAVVLNREFGFNCRAVGIVDEYALVAMDEYLLTWADEVVFMEENHFFDFTDKFGETFAGKNILDNGLFQVLNIPDTFGWMDEELQGHILERYNPEVVEK